MNKRTLYLLLVFFIFFSSCENDDGGRSTSFIGYQYLPLNSNQESIYQVDSIKYDDFTGLVDTISFQRREVIGEKSTDDNGRVTYVVNVYERISESSQWRQVKAITKTLTTIRYEYFEDNLTVIPLVFPIGVNVNWDGNLLNTNLEETFRYRNLHQVFQLDTVRYDSTITILQREEENRIQRISTEEKYATNIGLIYRKDVELKTDLDGRVESGYEASLKLIQFIP